MEVKVKKSQISGEINCPPSKSYSHRAILISALASGKSHIKNVLLSRDTLASVNCIKMLGVNVTSLDSGGDHATILGFDKSENQQSHNMKTKNDMTGFVGTQDLFVESNGGLRGFKTPNDVLNADNSGTTIRITTSMCSLVSDKSESVPVTGNASIFKR